MSSRERPPIWKMVKEAVENLGGKASHRDIINYIQSKYGPVNESTIRCQITVCTVNKPSRVNFPQNKKPRRCDGKYDFLYSIGKGEVVFYDPKKHGEWEIVNINGKLTVAQRIGPSKILPKSEKPEILPQKPIMPPNPLLETAIYSLLNALELFQGTEERHRHGAIVLMDQAVEFALKAVLYQKNEVEFLRKEYGQLNFHKALEKVEQLGVFISDSEKFSLRDLHSRRNEAQHRAEIPSSPWCRKCMIQAYNFLKRFCLENFELDIDSVIPSILRRRISS